MENDAGRWVKLTAEAMDQLGCSGAPAAYALAFSEDRKQEFLVEKEVSASGLQSIPLHELCANVAREPSECSSWGLVKMRISGSSLLSGK